MSGRNTVRPQYTGPNPPRTAPIQWTRVLVGFALNVLIVTLGIGVFADLPYGLVMVLGGPIIMGAFLGFLVTPRPGVHAFLAGMLSIPFLALFVLPAQLSWIYAILAGSLFAFTGLIVDVFRRIGQSFERK